MIKPIAIYLPQFHPTPENNEWWGEGFTEWTNVTKAKPLFKGHYQPQLPTDLGFYDLRLEETRLQQEALAKEYGIYGFCYYHYWFNGKRILHEPLDRKLKNPKEDLPFMLCWANETWSRRWLGEEKEILIKQEYSEEDDLKQAEYLSKIFKDQRYIKVDEKPLFVIYRPDDLPNQLNTLKIIRQVIHKNNGVQPYIVANVSRGDANHYTTLGYDAVLNFRPSLGSLPNAFKDGSSIQRLFRNIIKFGVLNSKLKIYTYTEALKLMKVHEQNTFKNTIPCIFVGWDNTARRGENGIIIHNSKVSDFETELFRLKQQVLSQTDSLNFVFINAWNEWAEGNALEPNSRTGKKYLEVVKKVFSNE